VKFFEFVAAECPDLQVLTIHPGIVDTAMNVKSGFEGMPMDEGEFACCIKIVKLRV